MDRLEAQQEAYVDTAAISLAAKEYQGLSTSFASDDRAKPSNCSLSTSICHDRKVNKAKIKIDYDDDNDLSVLSPKGWRGCVTRRGKMYDEEDKTFLEERFQEIETRMQATLLQSLEDRMSNRTSLRRDSNSELDSSIRAPGLRHTEPLNTNESTNINVNQNVNVNVNVNINVDADANLDGPRMRHSVIPMLRNIHGITTTTHGPNGSEEVKFFFDEDTFAMMILAKPWSKDLNLAMITFSMQIIMGLLIVIDQLKSDSVNCAFSVNIPLIAGQFLTIVLCLSMQTDIMTPVKILFLLGRNSSNWAVVIGEGESSSTALWVKRIFPNVMKMIEGVVVLVVLFLLILQSSDIIELLKDFTVLMVVSEADNIVFHRADYGFLGQDLQERAHAACRNIETVSFSLTGKKRFLHPIFFFILCHLHYDL